ncbi:conserved hypothetical protein [Sinorhizobium fredii HH103]|uniref:Uncharacterized protein n=1 Tax=Sinorhizobium fredii (strain HH103) TaxID=1117943 RepID=G9ABB5_SINF1|nr:hypothetical protein [Sinorhizobium fredii]CCE97206.1 conserved hypothetical protein [Sinorhizobium fredii HH103]
MTLLKTLEGRFKTEWLNSPLTLPYYMTFNEVGQLVDKLAKKHREQKDKGTLSQKGLDEAMREFVTKEIVPQLARARGKLETSTENVDAKRQALTIPKPDKSDVAGALLRQELRTYLRGLSLGQRAALLLQNPDPATIAAVFEAPNHLSGIDDKLRTELEAAIVAASHPQKLAQIQDERDCIQIAQIAINHAVDEIRKATGYEGSNLAFDQFMAKASAPIEAEFAKKGQPAARTVEDMVAVYRAMPKSDQSAFINKYFDGDLEPAEPKAA